MEFRILFLLLRHLVFLIRNPGGEEKAESAFFKSSKEKKFYNKTDQKSPTNEAEVTWFLILTTSRIVVEYFEPPALI